MKTRLFRDARAGIVTVLLTALPPLTGWAQSTRTDAAHDPTPSAVPDRIVLTLTGDPATTQAVTWRTDVSVERGFAEIALAGPNSEFTAQSRREEASTTLLESGVGAAHYHTVKFGGLEPKTLYAYRVGSEGSWSAWFHFRTASDLPEPFTFIYFGDAQNNLLSLWARAIRAAYSDAPHANFLLHAGDLVNHANEDLEWGEWFESGGWIFGMRPSIAIPGNHEYARKERSQGSELSEFWNPQFAFPESGVTGLEETVYSIDYQGARFIGLNSNEGLEAQAKWLESRLEDNPNRWTFVFFHHPVFSTARGRDNRDLRKLWKPLFDRYRVDMVLQGHDHTYGRGRNLPTGVDLKDDDAGTVYVVSVSGPKQYRLTEERWMDRAAENTQLYQIISVSDDRLEYRAVTVTGEVYDAFELVKREGRPNQLVDRVPAGTPERAFEPEPGP